MTLISIRRVTLVSLLLPGSAGAVVIRHDTADAKYHANAQDFPALVKLPGEGQVVLIAPQWVVTAAHVATGRTIHEVTIEGRARPVQDVIIHPGYRAAPQSLQSGNAAPLMSFMDESADIALIHLVHPVVDVAPLGIYKGDAEANKQAAILGRGATGNGLVGEYPQSPHVGDLRLAYSRIISADGRWLRLRFDAPPEALPLEGMPADGDSGGPIMLRIGNQWELAGLVSHKFAGGNLRDFKCCQYGQITYQSRLSYYLPWIEQADLPPFSQPFVTGVFSVL